MTLSVEELNIQINYHIHKGYHKQINGPLNYLVKILGIDCEEKKAGKRKNEFRNETFYRGPNEKFVECLTILICKYRQGIRKAKLKMKSYEEVEETV